MGNGLLLKEYIQKVDKGELDAEKVVSSYIEKAKENNSEFFSFVRFHEDYVSEKFENQKSGALKGAPIGIKDNILTKGYKTSCGSRMLEEYIPPYSATCFRNLEKNGGLMLGKTNMDEFAMGSSTENSYYGVTVNPHGDRRVPGGSSGGSAAAVASDMCIAALGTDTGGSIRQPASLCGVVGFKPTYGAVSRYGVQAMGSSLDQVGTLTKDVEDASLLFDAISGWDEKDATSVDIKALQQKNGAENKDVSQYKIAVPNQFFSEGLDDNVKEVVLSNIEEIKKLGAEVEWIDVPSMDYALSIYYILMPAEVSTNLARFDGIRFGFQEDTFDYDSIYEYYSAIRDKGFQDEVKRRIIMGTYVLSAGYYDAYYLRAQKARKKMKYELDRVFDQYDLIVGPVSPSVAWKIGEKTDDPLKMYLSDIYTIPANLAGLPNISIPGGFAEDRGENLPVGFSIMGDQFQEKKVFKLAGELEQVLQN